MIFAWGSTYVNFLRKKNNNPETLAPLLTTSVISKCMTEKAASKLAPLIKYLTYKERLRALNLPSLAHRRKCGDMIYT